MEDFDIEMEKYIIKCTWEANRENREKMKKEKLCEKQVPILNQLKKKKDFKLYDTESNRLNFKISSQKSVKITKELMTQKKVNEII